jgi:hypothetical protein
MSKKPVPRLWIDWGDGVPVLRDDGTKKHGDKSDNEPDRSPEGEVLSREGSNAQDESEKGEKNTDATGLKEFEFVAGPNAVFASARSNRWAITVEEPVKGPALKYNYDR